MRITLPVLTLALLAPDLVRGEDALTLRVGTLLDGRGGRATGINLVVRGTKIAAVGGAAEGVVYDLSRLTILPGGIDTHVHIDSHIDRDGQAHNEATGREPLEQGTLFGAENAAATLSAGITTVQSLGATTDRDLREFAARGTLPIPRIVTSFEWVTEGDEETLRRTVRERVAGGADVIKIFASKSIREGGLPTLTEAQLRAACGEASAHGRRSVVHAHASEAIRRAAAAGCTTIEHGALADQAALDAMAAYGMFFDPNVHLVFQNYFDHEANFLGQGNYTQEGFAQMRRAAPAVVEVFKKALQDARPQGGVRHRRRGRRPRPQLRGVDLPRGAGRPGPHGRPGLRHFPGRRLPRPRGHDRRPRARPGGGRDRGGRRSPRRYHGPPARGVRDERRADLQECGPARALIHG